MISVCIDEKNKLRSNVVDIIATHQNETKTINRQTITYLYKKFQPSFTILLVCKQI